MQIRTPKDLGLLIRDQRKTRGWTQDVLAKRLDVSRLWIVQLEQGKATAQIGLVMRTLNELDVPMQVDVLSKAPMSSDAATRSTPKRKQSTQPVIDLDRIIREASIPYRA